jgi:hypothetical protein
MRVSETVERRRRDGRPTMHIGGQQTPDRKRLQIRQGIGRSSSRSDTIAVGNETQQFEFKPLRVECRPVEAPGLHHLSVSVVIAARK